MAKTEIWIGTIEIGWSEQKTPTVFQPAFTVVTTWAASPEEFMASELPVISAERVLADSPSPMRGCPTNSFAFSGKLANPARGLLLEQT